MSEKKALLSNSVASFVQQIVALIVGLILPKLIITAYGSDVNGTISSIMQFISITSLIQGGVSSASRVAFYLPVANKNLKNISIVYKTSRSFFRKFGIILSIYIVALSLVYPRVYNIPFSLKDGALLVIVLGLGAIAEYLFGMVDQLLLFAAKKAYVNTNLQTFGTIASTIISIILIYSDASVLFMKFVVAIILVIKPILLHRYVQHNYDIDYFVETDKNVLNQSNAALTKSIAYYVHTSTGNLVVTTFLNVSWVSVYSVHRYVSNSISNLLSSILGNTEAIFGYMLGNNETNKLKKELPIYDLFSKIISTILFFTAISMITGFVRIYTFGINDADYYQPLFGIMLCFAELVYCMSLTYNNVIMAAGHIKQTQWISIVEALLNLLISIVCINLFGIIGVALGTLFAFIFNTIANIVYINKYILKIDILFIVKTYLVNLVCGIISSLICFAIIPKYNDFMMFFCYLVIAFLVHIFVIVIGNLLFFKEYFNSIIYTFKKYRK